MWMAGLFLAAMIKGLCFYATLVAAVARVDLDDLALVDEEGDTNLSASLNLCRLQRVRSCIALQARLCPSHGKPHLDRNVGVEDGLGAGIGDNLNVLAFLHEVDTVDLVFGNGNLLKGLVVHENVVLAFHVEVLVGTTLYTYVFKLLTDVETALKHVAGDNVLQGCAHDGVTLSRLHMQEVDAEIELAIHADARALLDVL